MAEQVFPTKGNLIKARKTLALCRLGYDLMDRKRNILIREMMQLIDKAKSLRGSIEDTYKEAYAALQDANISLGVIDKIAESVPEENGISVTYRSVMGVDIPNVTLTRKKTSVPYGFYATNSKIEKAYVSFLTIKDMKVVLVEVDNRIYGVEKGIKKR